MDKKLDFRRLGTMIDCSRNAVMRVETVKRWVDLTADLGFNSLFLYIEDTYEVNDNPYFGFGRGRFSKNELKEIDKYAMSKGMEVIPCIQTLAHLNGLIDVDVYRDMIDCNDILLIGDERVYNLIDKMFETLSECLTTKHINVGMDEAHMIGRGKYYDLHGNCDKTEILLGHLNRVSEIAAKYGITISMWSDMFFRIASGGDYYNTEFEISDEVKKLIPENVELVYWDYYSKDESHYDKMFSAHKKMKDNIWFAGGFWTWAGFAPSNQFTIETTKAALAGCRKHGIKDIFFTMWGDDSAECSKFAALPSMFYTSELAKGNDDENLIKERFEEKFGIPFDDFMLLDLTKDKETVNPSKYILFNDLFNGRMNSVIRNEASAEFSDWAEKLAKHKENAEWGYLFDTYSKLSSVCALKADMGIRIRAAYSKKDMNELKLIIADCKKLSVLVREFYNAFCDQWMKENKGQGFDVQDIRVGGTLMRIEHCTRRLEDYVNGKIPMIEELEEITLDYYGKGTECVPKDVMMHSFKRIFTPNTISWFD